MGGVRKGGAATAHALATCVFQKFTFLRNDRQRPVLRKPLGTQDLPKRRTGELFFSGPLLRKVGDLAGPLLGQAWVPRTFLREHRQRPVLRTDPIQVISEGLGPSWCEEGLGRTMLPDRRPPCGNRGSRAPARPGAGARPGREPGPGPADHSLSNSTIWTGRSQGTGCFFFVSPQQPAANSTLHEKRAERPTA